MFNQKPTIDGAISHFAKGVTQLRLVQENSAEEAADKTEQSEILADQALTANKESTRAGRIADRLDDLLS